jgi:vacuolar-type H+-ATPase subunit I/STV1
MDVSQFIAQLIGPIYLAVGISGFINRTQYMQFVKDFRITFGVQLASGAIALLIGLVMIRFHSIWSFDWRGVITLFGWIALLKGITLLVLPAKVGQGLADQIIQRPQLVGAMFGFCILLGLVFSYFGYLA